jgi:hypothetical protein
MVRDIDMIEDNIPGGWLAFLAQSRADVEAGQVEPLEPIVDELRASIARMQARPTRDSRVPAPCQRVMWYSGHRLLNLHQ